MSYVVATWYIHDYGHNQTKLYLSLLVIELFLMEVFSLCKRPFLSQSKSKLNKKVGVWTEANCLVTSRRTKNVY